MNDKVLKLVKEIASSKEKARNLEIELAEIRKNCDHIWQDYQPASPFEDFGIAQEICLECGEKRRKK